MSFAPKVKVLCDVFYEMKDGTRRQVGYGVDQLDAERLAFSPEKPKGSKFVCKIRR